MAEIIVEFPSPLTEKEKKMIYGYKGELTRCKDCKYCVDEPWMGRSVYICNRTPWQRSEGERKAGEFCSRGERREE